MWGFGVKCRLVITDDWTYWSRALSGELPGLVLWEGVPRWLGRWVFCVVVA